MTVSTSISKSGPYAGAGTTGPFPITFRFLDNTHLRVIKTDADGNETVLALTTDYSVTGAGNDSGGSLATVASVASGSSLTILRDVPATQLTDYTQSDRFPAESHEQALDKLTMLVQQIDEQAGRAIVFPASEAVDPELPKAESRALRVLGFDADGAIAMLTRTDDGGSALALDLLDSSSATNGPALIGFNWSLNYAISTIGWGVRTASNATNILRYIPPAEWPALQAGTSNYDILAIFNTAKVSNRALFFPADMTFKTSAPLVMDQEGFELLGGSNATAIITQLAGFAGAATINVNGARLQAIKSIRVHGNNAGGSDSVRVTNGPLTAIENVVVKFGTAGIRLISGNNQRWTNVFAESNATGFLVVPDVGDNTNGCMMIGLRAFNSSSWGLDIQAGAGPSGHMHSTWDISTEGGVNGIRIRGGRYCQYSLYSEANSGDEFDLDPTAANSYFLRNPDADADGALANIASFSMGTNGQGANLYFDRGIAPERHAEQAFAVSGSLAQVGVTMWDVTNISGSTRSITLSFLSYLPAGFKAMLTKRDNTPGFTLLPPGGITLTGDTGTWGASVTTVAVLWVEKINSTTAICIQR